MHGSHSVQPADNTILIQINRNLVNLEIVVKDHDFVLARDVQLVTRDLVQHVFFQRTVTEELHLTLKSLPLLGQSRKFRQAIEPLPLEVFGSNEPELAVDLMIPEIRKEGDGYEREHESTEFSFLMVLGPHAPRHPRNALRCVKFAELA